VAHLEKYGAFENMQHSWKNTAHLKHVRNLEICGTVGKMWRVWNKFSPFGKLWPFEKILGAFFKIWSIENMALLEKRGKKRGALRKMQDTWKRTAQLKKYSVFGKMKKKMCRSCKNVSPF